MRSKKNGRALQLTFRFGIPVVVVFEMAAHKGILLPGRLALVTGTVMLRNVILA
jgi:hypothetical protein